MTLTTYTDIQIRVRALNEATGAYPLEATLDDGSLFGGGELRLDRQALLEAELDPEKYGLALFYGLFPGPVRRAYDMITGRAQVETDGRVRVRLWIDRDAAELNALPWERIYHLHNGQSVPLSTSARTPFSRYTDLEIPDPQPVGQRPIHLLFAIANPDNLPASLRPILVEEEVENLRQALGDLAQAEHLLMRTVELDEATGHPDLESDRATLEAGRKRLQRQVELGQQLAPLARQARGGNQALATQISPLLKQLAGEEDAPPELRTLGHVLLQLLADETAPDLSGLPPELAQFVAETFDLPEP